MHAERGKLLFRVNADKQPQRFIWAVLAFGYAYDAYFEHRNNWWMMVYFAAYALTFLATRKVAFYENGIHFPQDPSGGRARFIAWPQIERFHWAATF